ncbi:hypothetical protein [uncultured Sphingomonas sp.]|uniref:hypothetical protein n=1 Tax=uncultured Sphingomonas sp. TaxID=158754 RepID=UPI0025CCC151|nr:hypothetical protein [uncultured Sphingomonas sp.]
MRMSGGLAESGHSAYAQLRTLSHIDSLYGMMQPHDAKTPKMPWWTYLIGPTLGVATWHLLQRIDLTLHDGTRQSIVTLAAILIAAGLSFAIVRFARV